jgi:hypothetical protein
MSERQTSHPTIASALHEARYQHGVRGISTAVYSEPRAEAPGYVTCTTLTLGDGSLCTAFGSGATVEKSENASIVRALGLLGVSIGNGTPTDDAPARASTRVGAPA